MNDVLKNWIAAGNGSEARDVEGAKKLLGRRVVAERGGFRWVGTLEWVGTAGVRVETDEGSEYLGWANGDDHLVLRPENESDRVAANFADLEERLGWWLFPNRPEFVR